VEAENKRQREQEHVDDDLDSASGGHCRRLARRRGRIADDDLGFGGWHGGRREVAPHWGPLPFGGEGSAVATRSLPVSYGREEALRGPRSPPRSSSPC